MEIYVIYLQNKHISLSIGKWSNKLIHMRSNENENPIDKYAHMYTIFHIQNTFIDGIVYVHIACIHINVY